MYGMVGMYRMYGKYDNNCKDDKYCKYGIDKPYCKCYTYDTYKERGFFDLKV